MAEIAYWSAGRESENLSHKTIAEAMDGYLDGFGPDAAVPSEVKVYGYARMSPSIDEDRLACKVLEWLDEEYADPEGDGTELTAKMREAAATFCEAILAEYECWACECVEVREEPTAPYLNVAAKVAPTADGGDPEC